MPSIPFFLHFIPFLVLKYVKTNSRPMAASCSSSKDSVSVKLIMSRHRIIHKLLHKISADNANCLTCNIQYYITTYSVYLSSHKNPKPLYGLMKWNSNPKTVAIVPYLSTREIFVVTYNRHKCLALNTSCPQRSLNRVPVCSCQMRVYNNQCNSNIAMVTKHFEIQ